MLRTIKAKMLATIVAFLVLGAIAQAFFFSRAHQESTGRLTRDAVRNASAAFSDAMRTSTELMTATASALARDPEIRSGLASRDPARLLAVSQPLFRDWRARFDITHWAYWEAEAAGEMAPKGLRNVLRVHLPDMHGDFVERVTLARVARERRPIAGVDLGFTGLGLRVVVPVEENGRIIGYIELGKEIGAFVEDMKKVTGDEYGLLVDKGSIDQKKWTVARSTAGLRNNWDDMPAMVLAQATHSGESLIHYEGKVSEVPDEGQPLQILAEGGRSLVRGVFPIHDVTGAKVGALLVLRDISGPLGELRSMERQAMLVVGLVMLLLAGVFLAAFQLLIMRRLQAMTAVATRVVGGEFDLEIVPSAEDEVGEFETLFEQFRLLFVELIEQAQRATGTGGR